MCEYINCIAIFLATHSRSNSWSDDMHNQLLISFQTVYQYATETRTPKRSNVFRDLSEVFEFMADNWGRNKPENQ